MVVFFSFGFHSMSAKNPLQQIQNEVTTTLFFVQQTHETFLTSGDSNVELSITEIRANLTVIQIIQNPKQLHLLKLSEL